MAVNIHGSSSDRTRNGWQLLGIPSKLKRVFGTGMPPMERFITHLKKNLYCQSFVFTISSIVMTDIAITIIICIIILISLFISIITLLVYHYHLLLHN